MTVVLSNRATGRVVPRAASKAGVAMLTRFGTPVNRRPVREQPATAAALSVCMLHFAHQSHKLSFTATKTITGGSKTAQQHTARHIQSTPNITLGQLQAFSPDRAQHRIIPRWHFAHNHVGRLHITRHYNPLTATLNIASQCEPLFQDDDLRHGLLRADIKGKA
ncbi:MAG: hypothetical protein POG74_12805 [Acidocella sp.]|nr:hypothetical protein [Acidocella sp.]